MRVVVTGAGGAVARSFLELAPSHHDVVPLAHADLDVGDHHAVMQTVVPVRPDAIVNLAAFTKVDDCETDREEAYRSNATGPHNLALAARASGAVLLHVSTDYVFDGTKESPYDELDRPNPISVYARSKLGGEELVRQVTPEHFVVREHPLEMAAVIIGPEVILVIGAAHIAALHVIDNSLAIDESSIVHFVAQVWQLAPTIEVRLANPVVIHPKAASGVFITEPDQALPGRAVVVQ